MYLIWLILIAITKFILYLTCRLKYTLTKTKLFLKDESQHYFFQRPKIGKKHSLQKVSSIYGENKSNNK